LAAIDNPAERLRTALRALYGYYRETEAMTTNIRRDAARVPELWPYVESALDEIRALGGWLAGTRDGAEPRGPLFAAAIQLALEFTTWQTLAGRGGAGLTDDQAAELTFCLIRCAD
jgi:hypothetical protein